MSKQKFRVRGDVVSHERVFLVLEVLHRASGPRPGVSILCSRFGQADPMEKEWPAPHGQITASQLDDVTAWIYDKVTGAIIGFAGLQEMLPVEEVVER